MIVERIAIVGLGLIGGSLARALAKADAVGWIAGFDRNIEQAERAKELGVVDSISLTAIEAVEGADLVVLAVPVLQTREALLELIAGLKPGAIVTDVGSTKQSVLEDASAVFGELPPWFVAGHPIAGTERSGVEAGVPDLFRGRRTILTPHERQDAKALQTVRAVWEAAGSVVCEMSPAHHDEVLAATSHLPHVLAFALVDYLNTLDTRREIFANAAGGFRDFTRIASSSPSMWHDIVRANRDAVLQAVDGFQQELQQLRDAIAVDDGAAILELFKRARAARERYLELVEKPAASRSGR